MTTTDNLSSKGFSFFMDEGLQHEITQDAIVKMKSSDEISFFLSVRHGTDSDNRIGKIFILEEEFKTFIIDMIRDDNGVPIRAYDAVESLKTEVMFDSHGLARSIIFGMRHEQFYKVLDFLFRRLSVTEDNDELYSTCVINETTKRISCTNVNSSTVETNSIIYPEDDFFFNDFFKEFTPGESKSLWQQVREDDNVKTAVWSGFANFGFPGNKRFNYLNDIYPEITSVLDYRWHNGDNTLSEYEMRVLKPSIYSELSSWYSSSQLPSKISVLPKIKSDNDLNKVPGIKSITSSPIYSGNLSNIFDRTRSVERGKNDLIFQNTSSAVYFEFMEPVKLGKVKITAGDYDGSNYHSPYYTAVHYKDSEAGSWHRLNYTWRGPSKDSDVVLNFNTGEHLYYRVYFNGSYSQYAISDIELYTSDFTIDTFVFKADKYTVSGFTDIAKVDNKINWEKSSSTLDSLISPLSCYSTNYKGECTNGEYGVQPAGEHNENVFKIILNDDARYSPPSFFSGFGQYEYEQHGVPAEFAFSSLFYGKDSKLGGKMIFNGGAGNAHKYAMRFDNFLLQKGWTFDDFIEEYSEYIDALASGMEDMIYESSSVYNRDYCEFYNVNNRSPFDDISVYIPKVFNKPETAQNEDNRIIVTKQKVIFDQDGEIDSIESLPPEKIEHEQIALDINKDEFVSNVSVPKALRVFVSDFTKIKVTIKLKPSFNDDPYIKMRISTNDFTFMTERNYIHE